MPINTDHTTNRILTDTGTLVLANNANVNGVFNVSSNVIAGNLNTGGTVNSSIIRVSIYTPTNDYILTMGDSGKTICFDNSGPVFINVSSTPTITAGFRVILTKVNTGTVTIRTTSNAVSLTPTSGTLNQIAVIGGSVSLMCWKANTFILDGALQ